MGWRLHPGSALRLSQPLSGFSRPMLRGPVSCHSRPWDPPFRAFPSRGSRAPLEVAGSLAVVHRRAWVRRASPCHRWFHRRPRLRAVAWLLQRLWTSFRQVEACFPSVLGAARRTHLVPPASPASKLSSPRETVPAASGCPSVAGRFYLGFLPHRSVLLPRLGFSTRPGLVDPSSLLRPWAPVCDLEDRSPRGWVRPSIARVPGKTSSTDPSPLRTGPHRLSTATPSLVALGHRRAGVLTFRASKYVESGVSRRDRLLP
jgi:hypothetical protein